MKWLRSIPSLQTGQSVSLMMPETKVGVVKWRRPQYLSCREDGEFEKGRMLKVEVRQVLIVI